MTEKNALVKQIKRIAGPRPEKGQIGEICLYNKIVLGMQNYYRIATRTKAIWQIGNLADEPIYPIGYVQFKIPMGKSNKRQAEEIDEIKLKLLRQPLYKRSIEYSDNRLSLYLAQKGQCAVTGKEFTFAEEIHCHHKIPKAKGGTDDYQNLILVTATVHKLIHATKAETVKKYIQACKPDLKKLNMLRQLVGNKILSVD